MKKKPSLQRLILTLIPILTAAGTLAVFSVLPKDNRYLLEGSVELASATCFTQASGIVESILVQPGQRVTQGELLAVLDDSAIDNQTALLKQTLNIKKAQLQQLKTPLNMEAQQASRRAAQATVTLWEENLAQAQRLLAAAQETLAAQQVLYDAGAISRAELQQYEQAVEAARTQTITTQAQLSVAQNNVQAVSLPAVDEQAVAAAQADVDLTQLQIDQLENSRENYKIRAAADGVVIRSSLEEGATVAAGQGILTLASENHQYAVFYLPQDYLPQIAFGDEFSLFYQGNQKEAARGIITYIDLQAVYPPDDYKNNSNRNQRSVKIKIRLIDGGPFAIGQSLFLRLDAVSK